MAPLNLYDVTVPQLITTLTSLKQILQKAATTGPELTPPLPVSEIPSLRLTEDMLPFTKQIQIATDTAKFLAVRVADVPTLAFADDETTLDQLIERVEKTIAFLGDVKREDFEGKEDKAIEFRGYKFSGKDYVVQFALPNFFFHVTVAYSLLRMKGVQIGKMDYLGAIMVKA